MSGNEPTGGTITPAGRWPAWLPAALLVTPLLRHLVVVHAVPSGTPWRTTCPACDAPLAPVTRPAGRCLGCDRRLGPPRYAMTAVTAGAALLVVVTVAGGGWTTADGVLPAVAAAVAVAGWAAVAVPLIFVDLAVHRLPDRLTLPAAGWVIGWLGIAVAAGGDGGAWVRAALAAAGCGLGFGVIALVMGARGYGLGDAKLAVSAAAVLAWAGWGALLTGLFLAFLASGLVAAGLLVARRVRWRDALPFGPFLIGATLVTTAWVGLSPA